MDFPFANNAPAGEAGTQDDFWAFNPQQPPPMDAAASGDDTSLDELLALYQTAQDSPEAAPFAPMDEPEAYPAFPAFGEEGAAAIGDPATDQPFPAFGAEADMSFPAFDAPAGEAGFDFGGDAGAAFPAFDAPAEAAPAAEGGFDFNFGDDSTAFPPLEAAPAPTEEAAFPAFEAPAAGGESMDFDFGGDAGPVFPPLEETPAAAAAPAPAAEEELEEFQDFGDLGGPVFEPIEEPAAQAPAAEAGGMDFDFGTEAPAAEGGFDFGAESAPAFPAMDAAPAAPAAEGDFDFSFGDDSTAFPPLEAAPTEEAAFPAFEAPAAGGESMDFDFGGDAGPVFPPLEETPAAAAAPAPAAEEELEEFQDFGDLGGPVFEPIEEPAAQAPAPAPAPEPPPAPEPVAAQPPAPPQPDPEQTLRLKEVPAGMPSAPAAAIADVANLAALTGREVIVKTAEERQAANQQLTQVVGALNSGLDQLQGRMATLYGELQNAAVRRAPVEEIQQLAGELAKSKTQVGENSELYKQALYLRQVADAYLQLLKEL